MLKKYYTQNGDQEDLISIGTIGLIKHKNCAVNVRLNRDRSIMRYPGKCDALVVPESAQNRSTTNGIGYAASMTREMIARSNPSRKNRYRRLSYECTTNSNTMASRFSLSSSLTSTLPKPAVSSGVKTSWRSTNKYRILPVRNDF